MDPQTKKTLGGAISIDRRSGGGLLMHVHAGHLTLDEAEQLGALLGVAARAERARRRAQTNDMRARGLRVAA